MLIAVEVKPCADPVKGQGLFALEDVAAGSRIWESSLVEKLTPQQAAEHLARLPKEEAHTYLRQAFVMMIDPDHLCVNPTDVTRFMNHSRTPNCGTSGIKGGDLMHDVAAGDELTVDYAGLACPAWYQDLCTQYGVLSTAEVVAKCS